jgi:hypothetical protein
VALVLHEDSITFVRFGWLITSVVLVAHIARADDGEADKLFEQGRAFAKAGHYAEACESFAKSLAIDRSVGTELNLADCQQQLGHLREAWGMFVAAAGESDASGDAKRAAFARDRAAKLEPKLTMLIVRVAQPTLPGLVITIAGRAASPAPEIHERADPGAVDVIATAPNLPHVKRTVTGDPGATVVVEIPVLDANVPSEPPRSPPPHDPLVASDGDREAGRVHIAYGLGAGGIASAIAGATLTLIGRSHYNSAAHGAHCTSVTGGISCDDAGTNAIHDAQHLADIGTVFAIASGALLASSVIVYLTAPRERIYVRPSVTTQAVGMTLGGSF